MLHDWHQFHATEYVPPAMIDSRRRMRICLARFALLLLLVFARVTQLEVTQGATFRAEAARPRRIEKDLPGVRGRILARDGTVLAADRQSLALAVHYRYLEEPPDAGRLRRVARARLTHAQRKDPQRMADETAKVRAERTALAGRLAALAGIAPEEWRRRARRIQTRVQRIAESVRRRHRKDITVTEELDYHVMADDLAPAAVAEIEAHAERFPGVKILTHRRRVYPSGSLAAHVVGHLGRVEKAELNDDAEGYRAEDRVGRAGLERQYESLLRGRRGKLVELTDHSGRVLSSEHQREPQAGRDLVLTLDTRLQRAAEALLDAALQRRTLLAADQEPAGGAIVVIDVRTGAVRVAASAPRFDPNLFSPGNSDALSALLDDDAHPFFDRVCRMALPPGSIFTMLSAVALAESSSVDSQDTFFCRGYLQDPDRPRCEIYRQEGVGHGNVILADALAVDCTVYWLHHCGKRDTGPLLDWAGKFGLARPTGVDLPGEVAGTLPMPTKTASPDGQARPSASARLLAVGQGPITTTPLQIVRMTAALANGGKLVTPHVVQRLGDQSPGTLIDVPAPTPISDLRPETLETVRRGLELAVADPKGAAHDTVYLEDVAIAGKTGTARCGAGRADHAWFAGYVPAERPRLAVVVVLEHSGDGPAVAGPVAKRLVLQMRRLGIL